MSTSTVREDYLLFYDLGQLVDSSVTVSDETMAFGHKPGDTLLDPAAHAVLEGDASLPGVLGPEVDLKLSPAKALPRVVAGEK